MWKPTIVGSSVGGNCDMASCSAKDFQRARSEMPTVAAHLRGKYVHPYLVVEVQAKHFHLVGVRHESHVLVQNTENNGDRTGRNDVEERPHMEGMKQKER